MTVQLTTPLNEYTANGSTTIFPYTFRTIQNSDIKVYVAGVLQTSGYTVSQYSTDAGNVTFTTPPTNGSIVRIQRNISYERTTDYLDGGDLSASTLDNDFDRIVMMIQDLDANAIKELSPEILDAQNKKILNVATPISGTDAVNKAYVDAIPFILGNVVAPANPADNGKVLTAASGIWGWTQKKVWKSAEEIYSKLMDGAYDSAMISDSSGNVYLAIYAVALNYTDVVTSYLVKITPTLDYSILATTTNSGVGGTDLTIDTSGNVFWAVTNYNTAGANCYIYKVTSAGVKTTFATQSLSGARGTALAIDSNNNIFWAVSQYYNGTTYSLNNYIYKITSAGVQTTFATQTVLGCSDVDLVFDNSNYLYWAVNSKYNGTLFNLTNYVYRIAQDGSIGTFATGATYGSSKTSIIFDGTNLYWTYSNQFNGAEYNISNSVYKITLAGVKTTEMTKTIEAAYGCSLAVDSSGNLYWGVSTQRSGQIENASAYVFVRESGTTTLKIFNSYSTYISYDISLLYANSNLYSWLSSHDNYTTATLRSKLYINYNQLI